MAGLLDFLGLGSGGGLLGLGQPMSINQYGTNFQQQPMGMFPQQQPQQGGLFGGLQSGLAQIADPEGLRAQRAFQNMMALEHLKLQQEQLREKPQITKLSVGGEDRLVRTTPQGQATFLNPTGGPAPNPNAPPVPPGMDAGVWRKELTEAEVKNQQEAVKSAKAAADIMPLLDEAAAAYKNVTDLDAAGPFIASGAGRMFAKGMSSLGDQTGLGSANKPLEDARQRYDKALAAIQARLTGAMNQGQGAVSNFERMLYSAQYPQLTDQNFGSGQNIWEQMRGSARQTIDAAKTSPLSRSPSVAGVMERPPITPGAQPSTAQPMRINSPADAAKLPSGTVFIDPNGVRRRVP